MICKMSFHFILFTNPKNSINFVCQFHFSCICFSLSWTHFAIENKKNTKLCAVVQQFYQTRVIDEFVLRGNAAILKCNLPSFVADFVYVEAWIADDGTEILPNNNDFGTYCLQLCSTIENLQIENGFSTECRFPCEHQPTQSNTYFNQYFLFHSLKTSLRFTSPLKTCSSHNFVFPKTQSIILFAQNVRVNERIKEWMNHLISVQFSENCVEIHFDLPALKYTQIHTK